MSAFQPLVAVKQTSRRGQLVFRGPRVCWLEGVKVKHSQSSTINRCCQGGAGDQIKSLLVPYRDDALVMRPVNRHKIGTVRNRDREVATPEALA